MLRRILTQGAALTFSLRKSLALLGVVIGTASIVTLINIGHNATQETIRLFSRMGTNVLSAQFPSLDDAPIDPETFDKEDLLRRVSDIKQVSPTTIASVDASCGISEFTATALGVTSEFTEILGTPIKQGRTIAAEDAGQPFVVVGAKTAEMCKRNGHDLRPGDEIRIGGYYYKVIGIADWSVTPPIITVDINESLLVPIRGVQRFAGSVSLTSLVASVNPNMNTDAVADRLRLVLNQKWPSRDIQVHTPNELIDGLKQQTKLFRLLLLSNGGISLILGGIGVMNVMLMSIIERRKEIGLRMAVGARQRDILNMFFVEALAITGVGAIVGSIIGVAGAYAVARIATWEFSFSTYSLLYGLCSSLIVGCFFGIYPAMSAARLDPVVAMRDDVS